MSIWAPAKDRYEVDATFLRFSPYNIGIGLRSRGFDFNNYRPARVPALNR